MDENFWVSAGESLALVYRAYTVFLLLGCLGVHVLVGVGYVWARRCGSRNLLPLELVYGLLNPLIYLLVFQPALFRAASPRPVVMLEWLVFGAYWFWRLVGRPPISVGSSFRGDRALLAIVSGVIVLVAARDAAAWLPGVPSNDFKVLVPLFVAPLYAFPLLVALSDWAAAAGLHRPASFQISKWRLGLATALAALLLILAFASKVHASDGTLRLRLLELGPTISAVAEERRLDPRSIAAILYVQQRDHGSALRSALEEFTAGAWLVDETSGLLLGEALEPPLGVSRVKPVTVLTALAIQAYAAGTRGLPSKSYRPVSLEILPETSSPAVARLPPPVSPSDFGKREVVHALLDPRKNLRLTAFVLDVLATDWDAKQPEVQIRARPDILATAFQLGFGRARPRASPQSNEFGRRVQAVYDDPWMREHFGTATH